MARSERKPTPRINVPPRRRYHFGSPGLVYVFVTLLLALGAFNSQNNLLFWAFGFSLAILVVSGVLSGAMLMGIEVRRERVEDAEVGGQLTVRYRVRNRNGLTPAFALTIEELPPTQSKKGFRPGSAAAPGTTTRIEQPRAFVAHIAPGTSMIVPTSVRARRRGAVGFRAFVIHTAFPFGLIRKSLLFEEAASAVILPAPATLEPSVLAGASGTGTADRSGRLRGPGDEFHSLREYNPGDNPRSIAWKASARRGTLLVRQSLAPAPRRVWIVLRLRIAGTEQTDALDERAISLAAAAIRKAQSLALAVGLAVPVARLLIPPNPHPGHADRLIRELGLLELGPLDARGLREPFPHIPSAREAGQCVCIHAGPVNTAFAPTDRAGRATHLSAESVRGSIPAAAKDGFEVRPAA